MTKDFSLGKLTVFYTIGNLASKVIGFASFFVYTFFLSKEDFGFFDLVITATALVAPIINLQIYDAAFRWLINNDDEVLSKKVVTGSFVLVSVISCVFTIVYWTAGYFFHIPHAGLIYFLIILQTFYFVLPQIARGLNQNAAYVVGGVLYSIVTAVTTVIALTFFDLKIEGLLWGNILALLLTVVYLFFKLNLSAFIDLRFFDKKFTRELIAYSLPLIPASLNWWLISAANRYIILFFLGVAANGTFAAAIKLPSILLMLCSIFSLAWQEKAIQTFGSEDRDAYYTLIFEKYFTLLFSAIIVLTAISKPLLKIAVESSYYEAWKILPILYLGVGFQALSNFFGSGYLSSKNTKGALTTTVYGAVITLVLSFLLVPLSGLFGASIATLSGFLVIFVLRIYQTKKYFSVELPKDKMIRLFILIVLTSLLTIAENLLILSFNIGCSLLVFVFFNRKILFPFLHKLKPTLINFKAKRNPKIQLT